MSPSPVSKSFNFLSIALVLAPKTSSITFIPFLKCVCALPIKEEKKLENSFLTPIKVFCISLVLFSIAKVLKPT